VSVGDVGGGGEEDPVGAVVDGRDDAEPSRKTTSEEEDQVGEERVARPSARRGGLSGETRASRVATVFAACSSGERKVASRGQR